MKGIFILIIIPVTLMVVTTSCQKLTTEELQTWSQETLADLDDYYLSGHLTVGEEGAENLRDYAVEERYLHPNKLRVDITEKNQATGSHQTFIAKNGEIDIFHRDLEEHYHISEGDLSNKLSFLFINFLELMAAGELTPEVASLKEGYKLEGVFKESGLGTYRLYLDKGLYPEKIQLYREDKSSPYLELVYQEVKWNQSHISHTDFDEKLLEMAFEEPLEPKCELHEYKKENLDELALNFDPKVPELDDEFIKSIYACEHSDWLSMRIIAEEIEEKIEEEYIVTQTLLENKDKEDPSILSDEGDYEHKSKENVDFWLETVEDKNIIYWRYGDIKFTIIGAEDEEKMLSLAKSFVSK
ncbi:hypothetical protein V2B37_02040 [Natranaerobius thermophilus JW/NM-WN-LF]